MGPVRPNGTNGSGGGTSVVTVTFEAAGFVVPFLRALGAAASPLEVVVVDNASRDGTAALVRETLPTARVIASPTNLGFAAGSNLGAEHASGDVLAFLNPDTVPPPGAVERLARPVRERPGLGAAGCKLVFPDGRIQSAGGMLGPNGHSVHRGYGEPDRRQYDVEAAVDYVPGGALAIRRALFLELGGFYPGYFPGFYEDVELCLRLRERGYDVRYFPEPAIRHLESPSMRRAYAFWLTRNRLLFLARNGRAADAMHVVAVEALWLHREYLRPLLASVLGHRPSSPAAEWRRTRPVLAAIAVAAAVAPRAIWQARRMRGRALSRGTPSPARDP